jgi:hypothetical protein
MDCLNEHAHMRDVDGAMGECEKALHRLQIALHTAQIGAKSACSRGGEQRGDVSDQRDTLVENESDQVLQPAMSRGGQVGERGDLGQTDVSAAANLHSEGMKKMSEEDVVLQRLRSRVAADLHVAKGLMEALLASDDEAWKQTQMRNSLEKALTNMIDQDREEEQPDSEVIRC